MNWLTNFIRPRIRSIVGEQKDVPDNLWQKCESCDGMLFHKELKANLNVCYHCGHHLAIEVKERRRATIAADENALVSCAEYVTLQWAKSIEIVEGLFGAHELVRDVQPRSTRVSSPGRSVFRRQIFRAALRSSRR